ncbi:MAG: DUF4252 domain-containing protein [Acidobacteria bacterium]|nr:DUF4252 domain-containing protein [Acidobacteriota bacterium]
MKMIIGLVTAAVLLAQPVKWPASFEALSKKSKETVDLTLDADALGLASKFLSADDKSGGDVKKLIKGVEGIYIKSFEFDKPGEYSKADVELIRSQIKGPEWTRIMKVSEKNESDTVEIFVRKVNGQNAGFFLLASEPTELTAIQIVGSISLNDLSGLGGFAGIPNMSLQNLGKGASSKDKKDKKDPKDEDEEKDLDEVQ